MGILTLIFIAVSLAMDAFTVSIAKGMSLKRSNSEDGINMLRVRNILMALRLPSRKK